MGHLIAIELTKMINFAILEITGNQNLYIPKWVFMRIYAFTNPSGWEGYDFRSIFKRSLTDLNVEFFFSLTGCIIAGKEHSRPCFLSTVRFIPFPKLYVLGKMPSATSRIWTRVAEYISYGDRHYTTSTYYAYIWWYNFFTTWSQLRHTLT